jgi:dihydrofolate synthase/folylpolyglutamate synthase
MIEMDRATLRVYDDLMSRVGEANPRPRIEPVRRLAELAGSPQLSFPVIQVAGTNGKTSTSRAIESLLRAHGLRTGLFTSPHLKSFSERFQVAGTPISGEVLAENWDALRKPLEILDAQLKDEGLGPITFFEALVVLAFALFADAPVDVAVIEVGMGGEWDATNIVDAEVAVFTPIALDHTAVLGADLAKIARTKAGIIKTGCQIVSAAQNDEVFDELQNAAEAREAQLFVMGRDFLLHDDLLAVGGRQLSIEGLRGQKYEPVYAPVYGSYQSENLTLALAAVEAFFGAERPLPADVLAQGFGELTVPGRLQLIGTDPIVYVDSAHNPHGAEALARAVTETFAFDELAVVVGVLADKDAEGVLAALLPIADALFLTPVGSPRSIDVDQLGAFSHRLASDQLIEIGDSLSEVLEAARSWATGVDGRAVLVTGSVLLAGEAMQHAQDEGWAIV